MFTWLVSDIKTMGFTKFRWICTFIGLIFAMVDIVSDLLQSMQYFNEGYYTWSALILSFLLIGSLCTQIFSYSWFRDDCKVDGETKSYTTHMGLLHLLHLGVLSRHYDLLKRSFNCVWRQHSQSSNELFGLAADLSMLRLMETFLESVPQLILQTYIMLHHRHTSKTQSPQCLISMVVSFLNAAWSTVDYWRCLRRSLHNTKEMPNGIPTAVYLLYKILTVTARILSLTLFIMLTPWSILLFVITWIATTTWALILNTNFCTSLCLEQLYRSVVGVILIFTFFNIKGTESKKEMTIYYILSMLHNFSAPGFMYLFKPKTAELDFFIPITIFILISNIMGLVLLILYYSILHPRNRDESDVVDGMVTEDTNNFPNPSRSERFLRF